MESSMNITPDVRRGPLEGGGAPLQVDGASPDICRHPGPADPGRPAGHCDPTPRASLPLLRGCGRRVAVTATRREGGYLIENIFVEFIQILFLKRVPQKLKAIKVNKLNSNNTALRSLSMPWLLPVSPKIISPA